MRVGIFHYGVGNVFSLKRAFERLGAEVYLDSDPGRTLDRDLIVLPGVGHFDAAGRTLRAVGDGLSTALREGKACLGICLGMQLLFETSEEGEERGLAFLKGRVRTLRTSIRPHMGWSHVRAPGAPSLEGRAYFAHSYAVEPADSDLIVASSTYESDEFPSVIRKGQTWGIQFHPEKSAQLGKRWLNRVMEEVVS